MGMTPVTKLMETEFAVMSNTNIAQKGQIPIQMTPISTSAPTLTTASPAGAQASSSQSVHGHNHLPAKRSSETE